MNTKRGKSFAIAILLLILTSLLLVLLVDTSPEEKSKGPTPPLAEPPSSRTLPAQFAEAGWWNRPYTKRSGEWVYPNFPIACNDNPDDRAVQVLWVYPEGSASKLNRGSVWKSLAAAASVFAASARKRITDEASLERSLSPRFVTDSNCRPEIIEVSAPRSAISGEADVTLWPWLRERGYSDQTRKYLSLTQSPTGFPGLAEVYYQSGVPDPSRQYANTGSSHMTVDFSSYGDWTNTGSSVAHEISHGLGAVGRDATNYNLRNTGHPKDCYDLLCYGGGRGQVYLSACGRRAGRDAIADGGRKFSFRLDCRSDDYFTLATTGWPTERWNMARSSYLWGNEQPMSLVSRGSGSAPKPLVVKTGGEGFASSH